MIQLIKEVKVMSNEEKSFSKTSINWVSGAYRKLYVTVDISDFQKNTSCIFNKKWKGE